MNPLNHTLGSLPHEIRGLEDLADVAEVDLVGRLVPALAPDWSEEECPGVAVAGVAVAAQADPQPLLLQLPLLPPSLLLVNLPASLVPATEKIQPKIGPFVPTYNHNKNDFELLYTAFYRNALTKATALI